MDPNKIIMGAANIFIGGTVPASGSNISVNTTTGVPSNGGTNVGATDGPATFRLDSEIREITAEQALSPIKVRKTNEMAELEFTMKQIDFGVLKAFLDGSNISTNITANPKTHTITGGGNACVDARAVTLVARDNCGDTPYYLVICLYNAYMTGAFEMAIGKEEEAMVQVTLRGLEVLTRAEKDRTYMITQQFA